MPRPESVRNHHISEGFREVRVLRITSCRRWQRAVARMLASGIFRPRAMAFPTAWVRFFAANLWTKPETSSKAVSGTILSAPSHDLVGQAPGQPLEITCLRAWGSLPCRYVVSR